MEQSGHIYNMCFLQFHRIENTLSDFLAKSMEIVYIVALLKTSFRLIHTY